MTGCSPEKIPSDWDKRRAENLYGLDKSRLGKFARISSMSDLRAFLEGGSRSKMMERLDECSVWKKLAPFSDLTDLCMDRMDRDKQPLLWQLMAFILKMHDH